MDDNQHYRYCFFCDKWLTEKEVNKTDFGNQPGGKSGEITTCQYCHKDLTGDIQIFRCPNHQDIILKVWGVLDGKNQEKIFYKECPKENQKEEQPNQPPKQEIIKKILLWGGGSVALIGGLILVVHQSFFKKTKTNKELA